VAAGDDFGKHTLTLTHPSHHSSLAHYQARKLSDPSVAESKNRELGQKGELLVVDHEKEFLMENGRPDLAERVRHVSAIEGDGAGYDIESFTLEGEIKYIEVKTTRGSAGTAFFISANEVEFARQHRDKYHLYRAYDYEDSSNVGRFYIGTGELKEMFELTPTQYRAEVWPRASRSAEVLPNARRKGHH
jgi:hypothetical protein